MSARKQGRKKQSRQKGAADNAQQLQEAMNWFFNKNSFEKLTLHGNTSWQPRDLVLLAVLWSWSSASKLTEAFEDARIQSQQLLGKVALNTYQGLANALNTWTTELMPLLQIQLHRRMQDIAGKYFRVGQWCGIAVDGSRLTTPRTVSNEQAFSAKNYGKGKTAKYRKKKTKGLRRKKNEKAKPQPQCPQIWVTLMWHIGLGLPWCWKLGPSNSSERQHVMDMIHVGHFLKNTLFIGDAGFVGYDFWRWILEHGHHFMVRVGGNVSLLRNLGYHVEKCKGKKGIVYCWPNAAIKRKLPPLVLRLVQVKLGSKKAWLLTSVLEENLLGRNEMLRLYKLRWGVELAFRGLKQTFERRVLRSRNSDRALTELEWSLFAMAILELFTLHQQLSRRGGDPKRLSFAKSLQALRRSLLHLDHRPCHVDDLYTQLSVAIIDNYDRKGSKAARYKPNKKDKPSCGQPKVSYASPTQKQSLKKTIETEHKHAA